MTAASRHAPNVAIEPDLIERARALGLDVPKAAEAGLEAAIREADAAARKQKERIWLEENAEAIRSSNEWVEKHGLPLEKHRLW